MAVALLVLAALAPDLQAASPVQAWLTGFRATGGGDQVPTSGRLLADGTFLVVARDNGGVTVRRHDSAGTLVSTATFYPPHDASAVAIDPFGAVFLASTSSTLTTGADIWVMKYDGTTGKAAWPAPFVFNGAASGDDVPAALALDGSGDLLVTGSSTNGAGNTDIVTLKLGGLTGSVSWGPVLFAGAAAGADAPVAIAADGTGNVVVTGWTTNGSANLDFVTLKYSGSTGTLLWGPVLFVGPGGGDDVPAALGLDAAGNVFVTGSTSNGANNDFATLKYSGATGAPLWGTPSIFAGAAGGDDLPVALAVDGNGNVLVTGTSRNGAGNYDFATVKYNGATGAAVWASAAIFAGAGSGDDIPVAVQADGAGNVIVTGSSLNASLNLDWVTLKYNGATGAAVWGSPSVFDGAAALDDGPVVLAIDGAGNVLLAGWSLNAAFDQDQATLKLNGGSGAVLWGPQLFTGAAGRDDSVVQAAFDAAGNVLVTGWTLSPAANYDVFTAKYDGVTGAVLWGPVYFNGAGNGNDFPYAMALDASGNAVVTGYSTNGSGNYDFATIKYSGATGAVLWGPILFDGAGSGDDIPVSVKVNGSGDVFVTGSTRNLAGDDDWATMKLSGTTGALLWGPVIMNGAGNGFAQPVAMALDGTGYPVVTGYTRNATGNDDWATVKYNGSTGTVLWGPVAFNGIADLFDYPAAIAVDSVGTSS